MEGDYGETGAVLPHLMRGTPRWRPRQAKEAFPPLPARRHLRHCPSPATDRPPSDSTLPLCLNTTPLDSLPNLTALRPPEAPPSPPLAPSPPRYNISLAADLMATLLPAAAKTYAHQQLTIHVEALSAPKVRAMRGDRATG